MSHKGASLAIAGFFAAVIVLLGALSAHGRHYAPVQGGGMLVTYAPEPAMALDLWAAQGVRGRVLVLFGRLGANEPADATEPPGDSTYLFHAVRNGTLRAVYHVIPDSRWDKVAGRLASEEQFEPERDGYRGTIKGAPLTITRLSALPRMTEPALVVIQGGYWPEDELGPVISALKTAAIPADMVVVTGEGYGSIMQSLGAR